MTGMLASVTSWAEARVVVEAGVDIVDLKNPATGALGALPLAEVETIVASVGGACPTSATIGDLPMTPACIYDGVAAMAGTGVDYVKAGLSGGAGQADCVRALRALCATGIRIVPVMFADRRPDFTLLPILAECGCTGVMLDTADKSRGGLPDCIDYQQLRYFVTRSRQLGLLVGLAGALRPGDIPGLLSLTPDYLGFRGALCAGASRTGMLIPRAVNQIRALIPRSGI